MNEQLSPQSCPTKHLWPASSGAEQKTAAAKNPDCGTIGAGWRDQNHLFFQPRINHGRARLNLGSGMASVPSSRTPTGHTAGFFNRQNRPSSLQEPDSHSWSGFPAVTERR